MDGIRERAVFCFWFGKEMSEDRKSSLETMKVNENLILITENNLEQFVAPQDKLHDGFQFLSLTHKSDYLRSYFMYHYGGVYSDIKRQHFSYEKYFKALERDDSIFCLGTPQTSEFQIANCPETRNTRKDFERFSGCCNFMFKRKTKMALEWKNKVKKKMDIVYEKLKSNDGLYHPRATSRGAQGTNISSKGYPLRWTEIHGEIFHPLTYKYSRNIRNILPHLSKEKYR